MASYLLLVVVAAMAVGSPLAGKTLDRVGSKVVIVTGVTVMTLGMFLLSRTGSSLLVYCVASVLIGIGLSSLLGAPIRYVTLNETTAEERSAAQGLVNTFTSIGQLLSAAVVGAIAASSPGAEGYGDAFALVGILGVVLLVAALLLKKRSVEAQAPTPQEPAHA
jgi:MFS family permease